MNAPLASARRSVSCPKYEPLAGTRRCRSYLPNGACARPDEFMCVEWLRANGQGAPAPATPPAALAAPAPPAVNATALASFQTLGVEVRLESDDLGELWLVPAYTGADRQELSFEHAALIATLCVAMPSARMTALVRSSIRNA